MAAQMPLTGVAVTVLVVFASMLVIQTTLVPLAMKFHGNALADAYLDTMGSGCATPSS